MLSEMDSAADIRIYNYKTGTVHTEKGVVIYDKSTLYVKCLGNECEDTFDKIWNCLLTLANTASYVFLE